MYMYVKILRAACDVKTTKCELCNVCVSVVVQISVVVDPDTSACVVSSSMVCEALELVNVKSVYYLLAPLPPSPSNGWYGSSEEDGHMSFCDNYFVKIIHLCEQY